MRQVTQDEWADHCSNFRTQGSEQNFSGGVSWLTMTVAPGPIGPLQKEAPVGALIGRVEYRPDGSKVYYIF